MSIVTDQTTPKTITGRLLPDSHRSNHSVKDYVATNMAKAAAKLLGAVQPHQKFPMPTADFYQVTGNKFPFGGTHYGIMIADLPEPHHFLAFASILGMLGLKVVDADSFIHQDGPLNTALLVHGTASAHENAFSTYSIKREMEFKSENNSIRFGDHAEISGIYPNFRLVSQRQDFSVDLRLTATGANSWFGHSAFYQHMSLLLTYEGEITHKGVTTSVSGLGTWEHWKAISLSYPANKIIPKPLKVPADFFTYQVLNLDKETQLLLGYVSLFDKPATTFAMIRHIDGTAEHLDADVHFQVLTAQTEPAVGEDGSLMTLPETFKWTVTGRTGQRLLEINATVDTPMLFGLATGYVGGYHWSGTREGKELNGRGYIEYIDKRD